MRNEWADREDRNPPASNTYCFPWNVYTATFFQGYLLFVWLTELISCNRGFYLYGRQQSRYINLPNHRIIYCSYTNIWILCKLREGPLQFGQNEKSWICWCIPPNHYLGGRAEDQEFLASLGIKVKMKQACPLYMKPCLRVGYELAWGGF